MLTEYSTQKPTINLIFFNNIIGSKSAAMQSEFFTKSWIRQRGGARVGSFSHGATKSTFYKGIYFNLLVFFTTVIFSALQNDILNRQLASLLTGSKLKTFLFIISHTCVLLTPSFMLW